jgi:hypothetical protein
MKSLSSLFLFICLVAIRSHAQVDTIRLSTNDLITANLKPGLHQYVVYFEEPRKKRLSRMSIWNRQVNFKKHGGNDVIEVIQHWHGSDTTSNRYVYSISERKNFAPIYHYTKSARGIEAFDFDKGKKISGSDTVSGNTKKDLDMALHVPTINWELDLEVFNTLPFKKEGQRFIINFYHPGGTPPAYYEYAVTGAEKVATVEGNTIDCWKLKIHYRQDSWAIFWISKKSKEVLKMQEYFQGRYRYKVRLVTPVPLTGG